MRSQRDAIVLNCDGHIFVGPDNGVFSLLKGEVFKIDVTKLNQKLLGYGVVKSSNTFHGRGLFAPTAAFLEIGDKDFLEIKDQIMRLSFKKEISKDSALLTIMYVD